MLRTAIALVSVLALCAGCRSGGAGPSPSAAAPPTPAERRGPVLEGVARTTDGAPVADAVITLYAGFATRWRIGEARTDAQGQYRFAPMPQSSMIKHGDGPDAPWFYYVGMQIQHPGYAAADGQSWWDIEAPMAEDAVVRHDFKMTRAGTLRGRLVDAAGRPLAGVGLRIATPSPDQCRFLRYTTTDGAGEFVEAGLFPADYIIDVNDDDYPVVGKASVRPAAESTVTLTLARN